MEECPICLDNLKTDIVVLHCFHKFHTKCIIKCKRYSQQCPMCRNPIITAARVNCIIKDNVVSYKQYGCRECAIL